MIQETSFGLTQRCVTFVYVTNFKIPFYNCCIIDSALWIKMKHTTYLVFASISHVGESLQTPRQTKNKPEKWFMLQGGSFWPKGKSWRNLSAPRLGQLGIATFIKMGKLAPYLFQNLCGVLGNRFCWHDRPEGKVEDAMFGSLYKLKQVLGQRAGGPAVDEA